MNKKNKSKNNKLYKVFKVLEYLGWILLIISFVLVIFKIIPYRYFWLLMVFCTLCFLPDLILSVIEARKSDSAWGCYYIKDLFGLVFALIIALICFFKLE